MQPHKFAARHWRLLLFIALVLGAAIASHVTGFERDLSLEGAARLRTRILALGLKGVIAYVVFYVVLVTLGLPNLPFQLAAAAIYGLWPAFTMMIIGVNLGALGAFGLARLLGRKSLEEMFGHRLHELNRRIERGGRRFLFTLRLVPLLPFNAINYAAGISRLRVRDYVAANLIGMIPLTFLHTAFGSAAAVLNLKDPHSWIHPRLWLPVLGSLLLLTGAFILDRRQRRTNR